MLKTTALFLLSIFAFSGQTQAWGADGHIAVAQVAQSYLSPKASNAVKSILDPSTGGTLDSVANWADHVRGVLPWSGALHFFNSPNDDPPKQCTFTWKQGGADVINAIYNYTDRLTHEKDAHQREQALRFLVHFMGDSHQPLHMCGKLKGGNDAPAIFEGHKTSLHSVWDSRILTKISRELGTVSFVDHVKNLTKTVWKKESKTWSVCPSAGKNAPPVCPEHWLQPIGKLNCEVVWQNYSPTTELSTGAYWDKVSKNLVVERVVAQAGVRLAAVLNTILGK
ncbi:uncharacterized protein VTP21DRAFT_8744 [Calcarisporiella thermophila]|uniref:uncharacterized protein n=1 Tax=Calcarisporiella thermophila TaxID=911321 RepID=UPI0037445CF9